MPSSQFTIYTSADPGGPGYITGTSGSLLAVLNAVLVNGYGSKPAAGWTKPLADSGSVYGCFQQPTGSKMNLFINDNAPNATAGFREAWAVGWESMTSVFSGSATANNGMGTNQFPLPSQLLTSGHTVWRKSVSVDTTLRYWIIAADSSSFHMWIQSGDVAGAYYYTGFGDCYSLAGPSDKWKCCIMGRATENVGASATGDWTDLIPFTQGPGGFPNLNYITLNQPGHYIARTAWGSGVSLGFTKRGDSGVTQGVSNASTGPTSVQINGIIPSPNCPDGELYMCPLYVVEPSGVVLRGRIRGLYQVGHPFANFSDGQLIQGNNDFAGKTFMIVRLSTNNSYWALEVSNTVETN